MYLDVNCSSDEGSFNNLGVIYDENFDIYGFYCIFRWEFDGNLCSRARIGVIFDLVGPYKSLGNYWYDDGHRKRNQWHIKKKTGSRSVCALE